ncbi:MAG: helix-turn-helix transcriptional regulator [Micavibrio sp.]
MHDLLHIDGKPFVLVPMHEYRRLTGGGQVMDNTLPDAVLDRIACGTEHPVKTLRKYRGLTQLDLASAAGISRPYLAEIETGKKAGSITALKALAGALAVNLALILSTD